MGAARLRGPVWRSTFQDKQWTNKDIKESRDIMGNFRSTVQLGFGIGWKRRMPAKRWKNSLHADEVNDDPVSQLCHYACPWLSHCNGIHGLQHSSARHLWKLPALLVVWWSFYSQILAARLSHPHFNSHQTRKWFWTSEGKGFLMNSSQLSIISIRVDTCRAFSHDLSSPTKAACRTGTQGVEVCVNPQVLKFKCQKDPKSAIISIINYNNQDSSSVCMPKQLEY